MTHGHKNKHPHNRSEHHGQSRRAPHKDWRLWTAVILMLAAMLAYVMTMDESEVPEGPPQPALDDADAA